MNFNSFTIKSQEAIQKALEFTRSSGQQQIEPVHLLKAIMSEGESLVKFIFQKVGANETQAARMLDKEIAPTGFGAWHKPNGGYFISFNGLEGTAKRTVELCKQAGVVLTGAGAPFPYGKDPEDAVIRLAPSYPNMEELIMAAKVFICCVKLASVEKLLAA